MCVTSPLRLRLLISGLILCGVLAPQVSSLQRRRIAKETQAKGMPPRAAPTEYQAQAQAGTVNIGAEFMGHSVPTPEHTFSSEDYIVIDAGLFGPSGAHDRLSRNDFSLRINGKKVASPSEPYELVFHSLKDPEWQPPEPPEGKKSSTGLTTGGGGGQGDRRLPLPRRCHFPYAEPWNNRFRRPLCRKATVPCPKPDCSSFNIAAKRKALNPSS